MSVTTVPSWPELDDLPEGSTRTGQDGIERTKGRYDLWYATGSDGAPSGIGIPSYRMSPPPAPDPDPCGAWGGCPLPPGHNRGRADIPSAHAAPLGAEQVAAVAVAHHLRGGGAGYPRVPTADDVDLAEHVVAALRRAGLLP
ncbi:hypothetical protein CHO01_36840 [Cellulomonas hominis]|uniref:Uncharacterized protein n=1 Tax=Cellulomonas hominis TaxID=156981 RepID=A0A511FL31_9CELL|nr:hypothetical protein [Cellulomonas hominis]MBB5474732.1 hypothetical protein [Cellulomonas hominis]NKY05994.1 hypothetical protein [Cellulomonas hominis]GEL48568.1 hypothetical protein CHO01_36840 [Cellulomonas hominis]